MRRRLINSTLAVVLFVIAVFGVSLVIVEARAIEKNAYESAQSDAGRIVAVVEARIAAGETVTADTMRSAVPGDRYVRIELPDQRSFALGDEPGERSIEGQESGAHGEVVTVQQSRSVVTEEVGRILMIVVGVGTLSVVVATLLAVGQARKVSAPLTDLAETAERLGSGDPRPRHRRYGVPELDRVADVLDASAERIARMLTAERRLAADASHQLRTPLTALSMRLEEIVETADSEPQAVKDEAAIALAQVERLTDVVERLLTNSRDRRSDSAVTFDIDEVVLQQVEEWRAAYRGAGRAIVHSGRPELKAVGTPGAVATVLATLVENALMHGDGTVALRTRIAANQVVIEVSDEGEGVAADLGSRVFERTVSGRNSTGIGLAVARDLAEADGGRLELLQQHPPVFALFLSREAEQTPG